MNYESWFVHKGGKRLFFVRITAYNIINNSGQINIKA